MRLIVASLFAAVTALTATACTPVEYDDELATEDTTELSDAKADASGTYTYYKVSPDFRRCASPFCGGYWVERVNRTTTRCGDGVYAERCYVADVDWSKLHTVAQTTATAEDAARAGTLLVRATVGLKDWGGPGKLGQLRPTEAWLGQGPNQPDGVFVKLEEIGTRCAAAPCPTFREQKLNGSGTAALAELGWDASGIDDDRIGDAINQLFVNDLIIAGDRFTVHGPAGSGKARTVTQFYVRAINP